MITKLRAENFKSWKDTGELQLAPLTGLFGTNSSGKSSILQMLLMLKQTAESSDRNRVLNTNSYLVDLGTFASLIYNHDLNKKLQLSLSWKLLKPFSISSSDLTSLFPEEPESFNINHLSFKTLIHEDSGSIVTDSFTYEFNIEEQTFKNGMCRDKKDKDRYNIYSNYDVPFEKQKLPTPIKCYGFPPETFLFYSSSTGFLSSFNFAFEDLFSRVNYLGPLREYPQRFYTWGGDRPTNVGAHGEYTIDALLSARNLGESIDERVREAMQKTKLLESFNLRPITEERNNLYEIKVKMDNMSPEVSMTDIGFGVSQILPVLVLCYYVPEGSIIILEQPEIHLHPSVQADLADVLIDVVMNRNVQIIVESHSEHLLRRLQRRIAEEAIPSDKVNLYFCRMENGASQIEKLQLDDEGYISNWPTNFFGDEMGDLVAMTEAAIKRREKE